MKDGHIEEFCRANPWCWLCKEKHYPGRCDRIPALKCRLCKDYGHDAAMCTAPNGGSSTHSGESNTTEDVSSDTEEQHEGAEEQPEVESQPGWDEPEPGTEPGYEE